LFNSSRVAPVKDQIAKEAYKKIKQYLPKFNRLLPDFESLKLAGESTVRQAINYAQRILDSEGGEAAFLLGKDVDCQKAFKYVMDIMKCNEQASLINHLKHINHLANESQTLPEVEQLADYIKHVNDVRQLYHEYIANPELHLIVSNITDLRNQFDAYLNQACIEFQTQTEKLLDESRTMMKSMPEYTKLNDKQRTQIDTQLDGLSIECSYPSIGNLREMINKFVTYYLPSGSIKTIENRIKQYAADNAPAVKVIPTPPTTPQKGTEPENDVPQPTKVEEPTYQPKRLQVKRKITTRTELQQVIDQLTSLLGEISDNTPVEFNFNED
jgi:hypothetical protein